jgi:hypothetical protein
MGRDAPDFAKYRVRPPATIIGVRVRYWSPFHGYAEPDPPRDLAMLAAAIDTLSLPRPEDLQKETTDG